MKNQTKIIFNIIRIGIIFITLPYILISCFKSGNNSDSNLNIDNLVQIERTREKRAKFGNENKEIKVIAVTDSNKVKEIDNEINEKIKRKKIEERKNLSKKSLAKRYKEGDKSVVTDIVKILKSNQQQDLKHEIYFELSRDYDDPDSYKITEPELISAILDNIHKKEDEKDVIQLAGYMQLPNYANIFETHLFSGKCDDIDRVIYWLGRDGKNIATINYVKELILEKNIDLDKHDYIMSGLENFADNGDSLIIDIALNISIEIYNRKLINEENFKKMKRSSSSSNPAEKVTRILLKHGDTRVAPIAFEFIKRDISVRSAIKALLRIDSEKYKYVVYDFLKDKDKYFDALYPATYLFEISQDSSIIENILTQFNEIDEYKDYQIENLIRALISMNAVNYLYHSNNIIKDTALLKTIQKKHEISYGTVEEIANEIYLMGIVEQPFSEEIIKKAKDFDDFGGTREYLYNFLAVSGLYTYFDAETDFLPVDYDVLITKLLKNSNNKISDFKVWMDAIHNELNNEIEYTITLIVFNKVYIVKPDDIGDWYDIQVVLKLLNEALINSNLNERYVLLDSWDQNLEILFGPPEKISQFAKKYEMQ